MVVCRYESNSGGEREIQRTMLELLNQLDGFDSKGDVKVLFIKFSSVLQPSSIQGLATRWTYLLHLSLSSVILIDSFSESPVHVLMLSRYISCFYTACKK